MNVQNILSATKMLLAVNLFLVSSLRAAEPEPKVLLQPVDMSTMELNEKQTRLLNSIKNARGTIDVKVVELYPGALDGTNAPLVVHLTGGSKVELVGYKLTKGKESIRIEWKGAKANETGFLTVTSRSANGLIYTGDKVYEVRPLGAGLQAVAQVNQAMLQDHPPKKD